MARTTPEAVALIVETDEALSLTPFIDTANVLVTRICAAPTVTPAYSDADLELIERWLAAHFYAIRDMRTASEQAKGVGQSYQYKVDLYLASTMYGQQAMLLDTAGGLAALNNNTASGTKNPKVAWLGSCE